jgi:hypothetical protein
MREYIASLTYRSTAGSDAADYEIKASSLDQAKRRAKEFAAAERKKLGISVRVTRVESRTHSDRRSDRLLGL